MASQPLEHDLLDLIEGRLAPDRVDAVRAALSKDAEMLRMVERMVADRRGVIELGKATEQAARADRAAATAVVREAIERAEREALFASGNSNRRRRISPIAAAIAIVAAAGLVAGGLTWFLLERGEADRRADARKVERSGHTHMASIDTPPTSKVSLVGPVLPDGAPESPATLESPRTVASLPAWIHTNPDPHSKEAVRSWTESVEKNLAETAGSIEPASVVAERALARIKAGGSKRLSIDEAATLAMSHRLRLVVPAAGLDWSRRRAEVMSAAIRAGPQGEISAESTEASLTRGDLSVEVNAPLDTELAGLRDALGDLRRRLGEAGDEGGWFELDESAADSTAALPSLRLNDILWWSNGPSAWRPGVSVRVRVEARGGG